MIPKDFIELAKNDLFLHYNGSEDRWEVGNLIGFSICFTYENGGYNSPEEAMLAALDRCRILKGKR